MDEVDVPARPAALAAAAAALAAAEAVSDVTVLHTDIAAEIIGSNQVRQPPNRMSRAAVPSSL